MPTLGSPAIATFVVAMTSDGQITVSQLTAGDLSSATLNELYSSKRDIAGATKLIEAEIIRNLP